MAAVLLQTTATGQVSIVATAGIESGNSSSIVMLCGVTPNGALIISSSSTLPGEASIKASGILENDHITIREVIDEILLLWGIESASLAKEIIRNQAVNEINATLQLINSQAKELDYLTRETRSYSLAEHKSSITLEDDVQNIEGPVRWVNPGVVIHKESTTSPHVWHLDLSRAYGGSFSLTLQNGSSNQAYTVYILDDSGKKAWPSGQSGERVNDTGRTDFKIDIPGLLESFESISTVTPGQLMITGSWPHYKIELTSTQGTVNLTAATTNLLFDQTSLRPLASRDQLDNYRNLFGSYSAGQPEYYYVDRSRTGSADNTLIKLEIRPQFDLGTGISPGTLSVDVSVEPQHFTWDDYAKAAPLPLPHKYVESLFLPIVRYRSTISHYYVGTQGAEALQANYQAALAQFGMIDPQIKEAEEVAQK
tara:strand:+ start:1300 stop:2571 length:1272 start_codon:yes stop_codon:yes gene_type:complete